LSSVDNYGEYATKLNLQQNFHEANGV